jgi:hypothetical protein
MPERNFTVRVIYKSGATMDFACDEFSFERERGEQKFTVTWKNAHPAPILIGAAEISAVYQLSPDQAS